MSRVSTLVIVLLSICVQSVSSQNAIQHSFTLKWKEDNLLRFEDAGESLGDPRLPVYTYRFPLSGKVELSTKLLVRSSQSIDVSQFSPQFDLPGAYVVGSIVEQERGKWFGRIWLMPIIKSGTRAERILEGEIVIQSKPSATVSQSRSGPEFKQNSVLSNGIVHKISVSQAGVYKLDYAFIKDKIKVDPATISPDFIAIYGNGGGRLPQWNNAARIDDLEESFTYSVGMQDGRIDPGDYFLWYAEGPDKWTFDSEERLYHMDKNIYDETNPYYVIINGPARTEIGSRPNSNTGVYESTTSLFYQRLEDEKVNLLGRFRAPGSGQEWYGDELAGVNMIDYTNRFDLSHMVTNDTLSYKVKFAARSSNPTRFYVGFNQMEFNRSVGGVTLSNFEVAFANDAIIQGSYMTTSPVNEIYVRYPDANGINTRAWLDYLEINGWKENQYEQGKELFIRDPRSSYLGNPIFSIAAFPSGGMIWDISNPLNPMKQEYAIGAKTTFSIANLNSDKPNEFIVFDPVKDTKVPVYVKEIENQNLHSYQGAELLMIYYDDFEAAALRLAEHRRSHSQIEVIAVPVSQVFEEFSGGSKDPSGIRDFARMIYSRDPDFKYLMLLGDATYDYLNRFADLPYQNFIPAFETEQSLHPIYSFPSDDYYALLDPDEGSTLKGAIDIAVGRIPVSTPEEAMALAEKIIHYDSSPSTLNDWRQRVVMVADDQDGNIHLNQADGLANKKAQEYPELNINKIYLDAYPQESTPGGDRYPAVNADIDLNMEKGALTVTYMGHGGQNGWTQERVLGINQCQAYDNLDNLPLIIAATCSFAVYDEPSFASAGELLLTNPNGGAIALMTTVRAVYSSSNERLTRNVLDVVYTPDQPGEYPGIAELLRRSKNEGLDSIDVNARKFTLLGDPSMKLAFPRYDVAVTHINGNPVGGVLDTLSALEKSSLSGLIVDDNGQVLSDFNGKIFLTVYDKMQSRKTLGNDEDSSERLYNMQNKQLFKGAATVESGQWFIEFVLPKDIDFNYGSGKLSFYAQNGMTDAGGYFTSFIIGGVSTTGLADDEPPVIQLFMNDDNFVSGGITDQDPDIYIVLEDDFGINVSGTGVGHDLEAVLDGDEKNSFILNDFYQAAVDDYTRGEVRYPLNNIPPGKHTLKVTAWDLANNPGEAYLEFLVLDQEGGVLEHVLNYPNPFTNSTNFQFEHNRPGVDMDLQVLIYTINGRLVKTIEREGYSSDGYRINDLPWDGLDDNGGQLAKGVYVYKIKVAYHLNGGTDIVESKAEKLVILR